MSDLRDMMMRWAQPGRVTWIGLRPGRHQTVKSVDAATIGMTGLSGDRSRGGKRAVTIIQFEHLAAIGAFLGQGAIAPERLRRNIVVAGLNLSAMRGRRLRIGPAVVELTTVCAPCSRMEAELGHGGYAAMRGHGGWCASVVTPGQIGIGAPVVPD